jgi:single-strand DNA-binding protein
VATLNKTMIIGNLGRDPEVKQAGSSKVANFSVGITEKFKNRNGEQQEKTEWVDVVFWGRQAEICEQYLKKGSSVYVEGKLETRSWEDNNGQKRYKTEIRGLVLQMLGSRGQGGGMGGGSSFGSPSAAPSTPNEEFGDLPF